MTKTLGVLLLTAGAAALLAGCTEMSRPGDVAAPDGASQALVLPQTFGVPCGDSLVVPLIAQRFRNVGTVTVSNDETHLWLELKAAPGWVFHRSQAAVVATVGDLPVGPHGQPLLGSFPFQEKHRPPVTEFVHEVDLAELGFAPGDTLVIAVHAEVSRVLSGHGFPAGQSAWATVLSPAVQPPLRKPAVPWFGYGVRECVESDPCGLTLTWPVGGEELCLGFVYNVTWESTGECATDLRLELLQGGAVCETLAESTANTGLFEWEGVAACAGPADDYALRLTDLGSGTVAETPLFSILDCGGGE